MLHQFYPDHEADSAYGIDYKTLYRKGYRGDTAGDRIFRQTAGAGISDASIIEQQGTPGEKLCGCGRSFLYI